MNEQVQKDESRQKPKQVSINFRWQPCETTDDGLLAKYIKASRFLTPKDQMIQTTRIFWLTVAVWQSGDYEQEELEELGRRSIRELQQQIERIARITNLTDEFNLSSSVENNQSISDDDEDDDGEMEDFEMS
ncbi:hypothetical protein [Crocosphaera watsonii]|uniref:Uncharacterized protein n=3 Tax=Crocosphaera watsonii TaxID=263511 RepID=T2K069_CROWT|nr:hypothetical protein [Crocosphaera watsonii]EHJ09393.1 hypothetical protein CWATWH0003_B183 [Crocosphaera watsonii WH 0003]CCQ55281.1 hypothetical protein CWATWH0005_5461 [Crocosphaera watsonii WH 0005]CCQ70990.1 hypothetical protein CWATWH0402_1899 [Crocosphaera watsonii WH 0402]